VNASLWSQRQVPCNNARTTHDEKPVDLFGHYVGSHHLETTMINIGDLSTIHRDMRVEIDVIRRNARKGNY
jgi:hypothetical protein